MISLDIATTNTAKSYLMDKNKFHNISNNQKIDNNSNMSENIDNNNNSTSNALTSDNTNVADSGISRTNTNINNPINNTKDLDLPKKLSIRLKNLLPSSSSSRSSLANSKPTADSIFSSNNNVEDSSQLIKRKSYTGYNNPSSNLAPDQKSFDFPNTPFRTPSPSRSGTFTDNTQNMEVHRSKSLLVPPSTDSNNRHSKPLPVEPSRQSSHFSTGSAALKLEDLDWLHDAKVQNMHTNENGNIINSQNSSLGGSLGNSNKASTGGDNTLKIQTKDLNKGTPDSNNSYINPDSAVDHNPLNLDEVINSMNNNQSATVLEGDEQAKPEGEQNQNPTEEGISNTASVSYSDLDANQKRKNIEFHIYFPTLPLDDILLEGRILYNRI
jgi:hypothetical protein